MREEELGSLTVKKLMEEAKKYPEISGVHTMKKEELLDAIRKASGETKKAKGKTINAIADVKSDLKKKLKALKAEKEKAFETKNRKALKGIRKKMKQLKRKTKKLGSAMGEAS